jgi:UPF0755 protein
MKKLFVVILLLIIAVFGSFLWWANAVSPVDSGNKKVSVFMVEKGDGIRSISTRLKEKGFIKSPVAFFILIKQLGLDKKIQAGDFRLSPSMTTEEIAQNLTHGTEDVQITIPEGLRTTEIAELLKENIPSYDPAWLDMLVANEGYLFPDTYRIPKDTTIQTVIKQMRDNFDQKYAQINTINSKLNKSQIVILASLIEREAITNAEKPIIAGILVNRLNAGIALQVDATIQYAKGQNPITKKWWEEVTIDEYKSVKSSYNTYLFTGLPPGPISNPGLEALRAAANPADTNYLYYLHDKNGQIHYAKTVEGHEANIRKYL